MIELRRGCDRGITNLSWLHSQHSFSFGSYQDPNHQGFGCLKVINEDIIQPGQGFSTHAHQNMEIITYVVAGALEHQDSLGNGSVIHAGDVQHMRAGTGIRHSEYNSSQTEPVHLLQIWIVPDTNGLDPSYQQISLLPQHKHNQLQLIGSRDGRSGSLTIHQDLNLYAVAIETNTVVNHSLAMDRKAWLQVVQGSIQLNDQHRLTAGDAAAVSDLSTLTLEGLGDQTEMLLFEMADSVPETTSTETK